MDKFHPLRVGLIGYALMMITAALGFIFIHSTLTFSVGVIAIYAAVALYQSAGGAIGPRLLPRQQYGQFCAATAMLWHFGLMAAYPFAGWILDKWGKRAIFAWFAAFSTFGVVMLYLLYLDWKKLGGDHAYEPPTVEESPAFGVIAGER